MKKSAEITIKIFDLAGSFAENKDIAKKIRVNQILPAFKKDENVILDYVAVNSTTQSFTHALISDLIRKYDDDFFDKVSFKNCSPTVKRVIKIVAEYMQRSYNSSEVEEEIVIK